MPKNFMILVGVLAVLATGLMADKCVLGDFSPGNHSGDTSDTTSE